MGNLSEIVLEVMMRKFFRKTFNIIKEGLKGIWVHRGMGTASVISTFATLLVIGIVIIISVSINNIANEIEGKVDEVEIFLNNDISDVDKLNIEAKIVEFDPNLQYTYRSSEDALNIMIDSWGEDANLLEGITGEDLLPPSYVVKMPNISQADQFVNFIQGTDGIDDINYYQELINQVNTISKYVQLFGFALIAILMVVSIFIISNTIKLTVFSRRQEISVMRYVGADNNYIRVPFMIEGLFFGLVGSLLAFLAVYFGYAFLYRYFINNIDSNLSILSLLNPIVFRRSLLEIFLSLGLGIGVLGSILSIRKYLKV